ncbi:MAG: hypothetical protein K6F92_06805 [Lachnospiraceae bacterium]|nr:hypothetical protein [Lachnospiraceae bacterium]
MNKGKRITIGLLSGLLVIAIMVIAGLLYRQSKLNNDGHTSNAYAAERSNETREETTAMADTALESENASLLEEIERLESEKESLNDAIAEKQELLEQAESASEVSASEAQSMEALITILENKVNQLDTQLYGYASNEGYQIYMINKLKSDIESLNSVIEEMQNQKEYDTSVIAQLNSRVAEMTAALASANAQLAAVANTGSDTTVVADNADFTYIAIGNSITKHPECDYWWDAERGMAASTTDKDYFHQVAAYLDSIHGNVNCVSANFVEWEVNYTDRAEFYFVIDQYLTSEVDLITLQLGENAYNFDLSTYQKDLEELIKYVKGKAPNAQIIIIDDFWFNNISAYRKAAASACGVDFVDLSVARADSSYQCGMGSIIYDKSGNAHTVNHGGLATHPGDKGHAYIAQGIINYLK